jgi:hypothetical protein
MAVPDQSVPLFAIDGRFGQVCRAKEKGTMKISIKNEMMMAPKQAIGVHFVVRDEVVVLAAQSKP